VREIERQSGCKVNLLLNILGKRADGFHELETVMHPVAVFDCLTFARAAEGVSLTCNNPALPIDSRNLVFRAASAFLATARLTEGVRIHLDKHLPLAAGLGAGSANAATTLLALNELFGQPLASDKLQAVAVSLGSDVPFFLQPKPALATGRGEQIQPLDFFPAFQNMAFLLVHPGFGIATAWAYAQLPRFPAALNGQPNRAQKLIAQLQSGDLIGAEFYNSLEAPAFEKYPLLEMFKEFLLNHGATAALMSGSGSAIFALVQEQNGQALAEKFKSRFGANNWTAVVPPKNP
jgi:4-diphosphocytidyl-2-C-methyl-D-erythritol kinase